MVDALGVLAAEASRALEHPLYPNCASPTCTNDKEYALDGDDMTNELSVVKGDDQVPGDKEARMSLRERDYRRRLDAREEEVEAEAFDVRETRRSLRRFDPLMPNAQAASAKLRFEIGDVVACNLGDSDGYWEGTVIAVRYREEEFPPGHCAAYQVRLRRDHCDVYAPRDEDRFVKPIAAVPDLCTDCILKADRALMKEDRRLSMRRQYLARLEDSVSKESSGEKKRKKKEVYEMLRRRHHDDMQRIIADLSLCDECRGKKA